MADTNGNGNGALGQVARAVVPYLLSILGTLVFAWAAWMTNETIAASKRSETAIRRIDGIVSTLSCVARESPAERGNRTQQGNNEP